MVLLLNARHAKQHFSRFLFRWEFRDKSTLDRDHSHYDVIVVGAGIVGAAFVSLLGSNALTSRLRVALLDIKAQATTHQSGPYPDLRVSTITPASMQIIRNAGAEAALAPDIAAPFSNMQVWDSSSPAALSWSSATVGEASMGVVVENSVLQAELLAAALHRREEGHGSLEDSPAAGSSGTPAEAIWPSQVTEVRLPRRHGWKAEESTSLGSMSSASSRPSHAPPYSGALGHEHIPRDSSALGHSTSAFKEPLPSLPQQHRHSNNDLVEVVLADGRTLHCHLLVGADGAMSRVRQLVGLRTRGWAYQQRGVVATVQTAEPVTTAWQRFLPTGPLALLPVRGGYGSVVWSTTPAMAAELEKMTSPQFAEAINAALQDPPKPLLPEALSGWLPRSPLPQPPLVSGFVGSSPRSFPLNLRVSTRSSLPGLALIGDACRAVHPLAGQGVNLGLGDAAALVEALARGVASGCQLGSDMLLQEYYSKQRALATAPLLVALDGLRSAYNMSTPPAVALRTLGVTAINNSPFIRDAIMRFAMGQ